MTPATIIREAQAGGVKLALSPAGTIKATGDKTALERWLPVIRKRKADLLASPYDLPAWCLSPDRKTCKPEVLAGRHDVTAADPFEPAITHAVGTHDARRGKDDPALAEVHLRRLT
jgi:hypothetical protein